MALNTAFAIGRGVGDVDPAHAVHRAACSSNVVVDDVDWRDVEVDRHDIRRAKGSFGHSAVERRLFINAGVDNR